jgi:hypothetical protein
MNDQFDENVNKPKKHRRRKVVSEPELGVFLRQYGRKSPRRGEPNDRAYSREIEQRIKRMRPEELYRLIKGDEDGADDSEQIES